jgi:hypothetical protein
MESNEIDFNDRFFSEFEYLYQRVHEAEGPSVCQHEDDYNFQADEVYLALKRLDANSLNPNELLLELQKREIEAKGFFYDDAQALQREYDKEVEEYTKQKQKELVEERRLEAERSVRQWRNELTARHKEEEEELIGQDIQVQWLHRIQGTIDTGGENVRINVRNEAGARILAKALWTSNMITSLDLSRTGLSDVMGAYICGTLRYNRSVVKLELGENKLGVKTLLALQASMRNNGTLKYVSLESNPLFDVRSKDAEIIIQALASIIETSTSLKTLILWRCGIGPIGGEVIAQSIMKNQSLTCLELGYNDWKHEHIEIITCKLEANKASCMLEMEAMKLKMEEQEKERLREEYAKRVQGEKNHVEGWLTQQGIFRCQQRLDKIRVEERKMEEIARKEAERIRQEKLTYEALAVKNSKKKKNYTKKIPPKRI